LSAERIRGGLFGAVSLPVLAVFLCGCRQDMHDQPKYKTLAASTFFPDGKSARPVIPGTVARGQLRTDDAFYRGRTGDAAVTALPVPISRQLLERGRQRFDIFCAPCHGRLGDGAGMVVQRGFRPPPSLHIDRLREAPVGHFFDVVSNGFGAMPGYASRIPAADRWAIIAYVRALQLSQNARLEDVGADQRKLLEATP